MLPSLFYLETALHISGGTITHHQERKYLQHLTFATPFLLSAASVEELELVLRMLWVAYASDSILKTSPNSSTIAADSSNGVTNVRCCRYSCLRS
jgi:hypothetical protein